MCRQLFARVFGPLLAVLVLAALGGCGSSVDPALLKTAGDHGDQLQQNYSLLGKKILRDASTRDLKDINAALAAGDLKRATPGDLRRAEGEIDDRIDAVEKYRRQLLAAGASLRKTTKPDFEQYLGNSSSVASFSGSYSDVTTKIRRGSTATIAATGIALRFLERYLDFLEQWEELVTRGDSSGLEASAAASDRALADLERRKRQLDRLTQSIGALNEPVDQMARAASADADLSALVSELKQSYPKSFLAVHLKAK